MTDHDKLRDAIAKERRYLAVAIPRCDEGARITLKEWGAILDAAESTLPKTKMVEVWRVAFAGSNGRPYGAVLPTEDEANNYARMRRDEGATCIRVTGPHQQEVPA